MTNGSPVQHPSPGAACSHTCPPRVCLPFSLCAFRGYSSTAISFPQLILLVRKVRLREAKGCPTSHRKQKMQGLHSDALELILVFPTPSGQCDSATLGSAACSFLRTSGELPSNPQLMCPSLGLEALCPETPRFPEQYGMGGESRPERD